MADERERPDPRGRWVWVAIGCGGFALSALCVTPPALFLAARGGVDAPGPSAPRPLPAVPAPSAPIPPSPPQPPPPPQPPAPPAPPTAPWLPPPPTPSDTSARRVTAVVEEAEGVPGLAAGQRCAFDVTRHPRRDGTFWCNAQVRCGGRLLYGGPRAGYFECTLYETPVRHVLGEDAETSSEDFDAAMRLDTLGEELTVRDDARGPLGAFSVRARVTQVE